MWLSELAKCEYARVWPSMTGIIVGFLAGPGIGHRNPRTFLAGYVRDNRLRIAAARSLAITNRRLRS